MDEPTAQFRRWATNLFTALFALTLIIGLIVVGASADVPFLSRVSSALGAVLVVVTCFVLVQGLGRGAPWTDRAVVACCQILVVVGTVQVIHDLTRSTITIPLAAIGALFVLSRRPLLLDEPAAPRDPRVARTAIVVTLAFLVGMASPLLVAAMDRTGLLSAGREALHLDLRVACGTLRPAGGPATITLTASWHWDRRDPFPASNDGLVLTWDAQTDDASASADYLLEDATSLAESAGLWYGSSSPSAAMVEAIMANGWSMDVGIDLETQRMADGSVKIHLGPVDDVGPAHGTLVASAHYVHLGRWERESETVICEW